MYFLFRLRRVTRRLEFGVFGDGRTEKTRLPSLLRKALLECASGIKFIRPVCRTESSPASGVAFADL